MLPIICSRATNAELMHICISLVARDKQHMCTSLCATATMDIDEQRVSKLESCDSHLHMHMYM